MKRGAILVLAVALLVLAYLWLRPSESQVAKQPSAPESAQKTAPAKSSDTTGSPANKRGVIVMEVAPGKASLASGEIVLSGRVVSRANGEGIPDAELAFFHNGASHSVVSTTGGAFRFVAPVAGSYQLGAVIAKDYEPFAPEWGESPMIFQARPGQQISDLLIYLDPEPKTAAVPARTDTGLSISGVTVGAGGEPLAEVSVRARSADRFARESWSSRSDPDGKFVLMNLQPGNYTIVATKPERVSATVTGIAAGSKDVELRLESDGGYIRGRVTAKDSPGGVASFMVVLARPQTSKLVEEAISTSSFLDPQGRYQLGPLEAGSYAVRVAAHGYATSEPQTIAVLLGKSSTADFELEKGATIYGTVVSATSSVGVAGARVELEGRPLGDGLPLQIETSVLTAADGSFTLAGVTPGLRALSAEAKGFDIRIVSGIDVLAESTVGPIEVRLTPLASPDAEQKRELTGIGAALSAEGEVLLVGQVMDGGGAKAAGVVPGDRIVAIDGTFVRELDMNGAVQRIRGPEGSIVRLTVRRVSGGEEVIHVFRRKIRA